MTNIPEHCLLCDNTDTSEEIIHDIEGKYICVRCYHKNECKVCNNPVYEKWLYEKNIKSIPKISQEIVCLTKFFNDDYLLCPYCVEKYITIYNSNCFCYNNYIKKNNASNNMFFFNYYNHNNHYYYNNKHYHIDCVTCNKNLKISEKGKKVFLDNVITTELCSKCCNSNEIYFRPKDSIYIMCKDCFSNSLVSCT